MSEINSSSKKDHEEEIIKIIKEVCRVPNLKPEDWHTYGPKVIYFY
jgi:hypothetical protein